MMTRPCDMLPPVRGSIIRGAPLKDLVWFRAGGPAEVLFRPADVDDLAAFIAARFATPAAATNRVVLVPSDAAGFSTLALMERGRRGGSVAGFFTF